MPEDDRPELLVKLHERRLHHQQRGRLHRAAIVALGFFLIMIGIVMSGPGVPGPGIATILVGLTFLALEFDRAERLLERAIRWADVAKDRAEQSTRRERALSAAAGLLALAAVVAAVLLWDIPLLPV
ncbi:MAG TPA: PGPGW domain-containing protein [Thermoleophilaceae bacterium]|nr:PGPGW domain-containing protein [Thermoleophilaceae bacterium]